MGKTVDDLNLSDDPIRTPKPVDPRTTDWYRFSEEIDSLLSTGRYTWAESTLTDIKETVERIKTVTQAQRNAVANIEAAGLRGSSRRYEGYSRRRY